MSLEKALRAWTWLGLFHPGRSSLGRSSLCGSTNIVTAISVMREADGRQPAVRRRQCQLPASVNQGSEEVLWYEKVLQDVVEISRGVADDQTQKTICN